MSKAVKDVGRSTRQGRGGGAGRHPGGDGERPAPGFLSLLFGGSDKAPANIGSRKSGTSPKGRGNQTTKDMKGPKGRK